MGSVTFLFTDIEGSTKLWEQHPRTMPRALARHDEILRGAVTGHGGHLVKTTGDGIHAVFARAEDALAATLEGQLALETESWTDNLPVHVRMGLHTGLAEHRDGDYFGATLNRAARLTAAAHGGQIVLSLPTQERLTGALPEPIELLDLGEHRLRDVAEPLRVFQVLHPDLRLEFPPLRSLDVRPALLALYAGSEEQPLGKFVGRERELEALERCWERALGGLRQVVLINGDPGIGKTRLTAEFGRRVVESGATILYGRCDEELLVPYQPFPEVVRQLISRDTRDDLARRLGGQAAELSRVLPELAEQLPDLMPPPRAEAETERHRLIEALVGVVTDVAQQGPVLLVLDDLQWADRSALLVMRQLVRRYESARLLVLANYRRTELSREHPLVGTLAQLEREASLTRIAVEGFSESDVLNLTTAAATADLGAEGPLLAHAIHEETRGNPFFVGEIARHLIETKSFNRLSDLRATEDLQQYGIPEGIRDAIIARVARLTSATEHALNVASVIGQEFDFNLLHRASELAVDATAVALDEAVAAGLLLEMPDAVRRYTFSHALLRHTLYRELGVNRRFALHQRVLSMLEQYAGEVRPPFAELAYHAYATAAISDKQKAIDYARRAGDVAVEQVAYEVAARHYARAREVAESVKTIDRVLQCELLLAEGDAHNKAGDVGFGKRAFLAAADSARSVERADLLLRAALGYGGRVPVDPNVEDERTVLLLREGLAGTTGDMVDRALALGRLSHWLYRSASREDRAEWSEGAIAMARRLGDPATVAAVLHHRYWALYGPDDLHERLGIATEIVALGEQLGDNEIVLQGTQCRIHALVELGDVASISADVEIRARLTNEIAQPEYRWFLLAWEPRRLALAGRFDEAERAAVEALEYRSRTDHSSAVTVFVVGMVMIRWLQGRLSELGPSLEAEIQVHPARMSPLALLAEMKAESGRVDEARELFERVASDGFGRDHREFDWYLLIAASSWVCERLHDTAHAAQLYELLLPYEDRNCVLGQSGFFGAVSHYLGILAATIGDWPAATRHLEAAVDRHHAMEAEPFSAMSELALSRALIARGEPADRERAETLLSGAEDTARRLGMEWLAAQATSVRAELSL